MSSVAYAQSKRVQNLHLTRERDRAQLSLASAPDRVSALAARKKLRPPRPGQIEFVEAPKP